MNPRNIALFLILITLVAVRSASGFATRQDAIWARVSPTPIALDGGFNEPGWALAESTHIVFGRDSGIPGSGWKIEAGTLPTDTTRATLKFLIYDGQLYMAARVHDASVGGSKDFNRFDGFLMALKDHLSPATPKPPSEYLYAWWWPETTDPQPPGQLPNFVGRWGSPPGTPRTPEQIANWDAVTIVHGESNNDNVPDTGYDVEMRFNLVPMGYNVTRPQGDIVEWNISIYDCDYFWPIDGPRFSSFRTWWQGPWGNDAWYSEVRIHTNPSVTINSGPVPPLEPEMHIMKASHYGNPVIDGQLDDPIWANTTSFDIRWGDDALRQTYPAVGPYRAGQFQPVVNGGQAAVLDPGDATVRMAWNDDFLYFAFDVRDRVVQYHPNFDRWDGFIMTINDVSLRGPDNQLQGRRLTFQVGPDGTALPQDYLLTLVNAGGAQVALALKPGTTVDTLGYQPDTGYTAEVAINLTYLGYASVPGDGTLHLGLNLLDGDSFIPPSNSYGTRTWWFREFEGTCCPVWAYMNIAYLTNAPEESLTLPDGYLLQGNAPNPSATTTIRYLLPMYSEVTLEVFDVQGRMVAQKPLGLKAAGRQEVVFDGAGYPSGVYPYQLKVSDPSSGGVRSLLPGRMILVR